MTRHYRESAEVLVLPAPPRCPRPRVGAFARVWGACLVFGGPRSLRREVAVSRSSTLASGSGRKHQVQLDFRTRELTIKLVYYGPALSGKTTNLQALHKVVDRDATGRLMTLDTKDDRTLFFDLLPL